MWKILQINWSNVILKSSWSSSWIRFRPLTPSALPQIHKNSLKAPLKADNQSQWLIVHCLHPNDTIWSWTCSSLHLWPEKWSGVPAAAACPPSPPHAGALDAHRPRSVSQRWSRAIRGNRLPAELPETGVFMTSSERRCQRPAASAEDRVCHRPVLHVGFRRRDGRHQLAWKRLTAATVPSAHVDQYLLQWKRDRVQTRSLRVCVCVCVSSRVSVRRVRPRHDPTGPHAEDMTGDSAFQEILSVPERKPDLKLLTVDPEVDVRQFSKQTTQTLLNKQRLEMFFS